MKIITIIIFCFLAVLKTRTTESLQFKSIAKKDVSIRQCGYQLSKTIFSICKIRLDNYFRARYPNERCK